MNAQLIRRVPSTPEHFGPLWCCRGHLRRGPGECRTCKNDRNRIAARAVHVESKQRRARRLALPKPQRRVIEAREKMIAAHPDKGGTPQAFIRAHREWQRAQKAWRRFCWTGVN